MYNQFYLYIYETDPAPIAYIPNQSEPCDNCNQCIYTSNCPSIM